MQTKPRWSGQDKKKEILESSINEKNKKILVAAPATGTTTISISISISLFMSLAVDNTYISIHTILYLFEPTEFLLRD
jgi:hypothetical protein